MPGEVSSAFLQYGAIGIVALVALYAVKVLFDRLTAATDAEKQRADRNEEELRKLNAAVQDKVLPVLMQTTTVLGEVLTVLREDRRP